MGLVIWRLDTDHRVVKASVARGCLNTMVLFGPYGPWTVTQRLNHLVNPRLESGRIGLADLILAIMSTDQWWE